MAHTEVTSTTVRLPRPIYEQAKSLLARDKIQSGRNVSLNDFIVAAIKSHLKAHQRRQIDAAFAGMAGDAGYQEESALLAEESAHSDWEAFRLEEEHLKHGPVHPPPAAR